MLVLFSGGPRFKLLTGFGFGCPKLHTPFVYSQLIHLLPVRVLKHFVYAYLQCLLSICLNLRARSPSDCNCLVLPSVN